MTSNERVYKLRESRKSRGLRRLELHAHPDDWPKIKELAAKLQAGRDAKANLSLPK